MTRWVPPTRFTLPGGYTVRIEIAEKGEILDAHATWEDDEHLITLRESRRRHWRDDFSHELDHVYVDWRDWWLEKA